ncbi:helix-turn-helix transcriptional regulator [bacterium]|nr:helix-turn-helix transcriptional regulator [bacterium]
MMPSTVHISRACREARRQRGLSQAEAAREIDGLSQPSLSRFEAGRGTLPEHTVEALALYLGVDVQEVLRVAHRSEREEREQQACVCESPWCPSVRPVEIGGEARFVPTVQPCAASARFCRWCGHRMIDACSRCGAAIETGIFCAGCGTPYVSLPLRPEEVGDVSAWTREERERREAITGMAGKSGALTPLP